MQRKFENQMKDIERLKEKERRNNYKMQNKERIGGLNTNNRMMYQMGEGMLGKFNLGGAGAGLKAGNDVSASQMLNVPKNDMSSYRSNLGVDKSVDNFKTAFGQKFGAPLGQSQLAGLDNLSSRGGGGAVAQPKQDAQSVTGNPLETSARHSNILSTPSSKGGRGDEDEFEK